MNRTRAVLYSALAALALAVQPAQAQPPPEPAPQGQAAPSVPYRFYASFDAGAEVGTQSVGVPGSFPMYGETATFTSQVSINNAPMINIEGGGRVWRKLFVSGAFAVRMKSSSGSDVDASIPHPLIINSSRPTATNVSPLENRESGLHISVGWELDLARKITVRLYGGPSFFGVTQDVVSSIAVGESGAPYSVVTVTGATLARLSHFGGVGFNLGINSTYMFSPHIGAGVLVRISKGTVDLTGPENIKLSVDAGGFDGGLGIRFRF